jgi:hypothetical protein
VSDDAATPTTDAGLRLLNGLEEILKLATEALGKPAQRFDASEILAIEAEARTAALRDTAGIDVELIRQGIEAFRLTREYVGDERLPALAGWSWFDWTQAASARLAEAQKVEP